MNLFQNTESGRGFLKDNYGEKDPSKKNEASDWLLERLKNKKDKIKDQIDEVK